MKILMFFQIRGLNKFEGLVYAHALQLLSKKSEYLVYERLRYDWDNRAIYEARWD